MERVRPEALAALRAELRRDPYLATALRVAPMQTLATMRFLDPSERTALLNGDAISGVLRNTSSPGGVARNRPAALRALVENIRRDPALAFDLRAAPAQVLGRLSYLSGTDRAWLLAGGLDRIVGEAGAGSITKISGPIPPGFGHFNPGILQYGVCPPQPPPPVLRVVNTFRVSQLTGDIDPFGLPHPVQSSPVNIAGVDEGVSTWFNGNLVLFFGDVIEADLSQHYSKAYATLVGTPSDPTSVYLNWKTSSGLFGAQTFVPLSVVGLQQLRQNEGPVGCFSFNYTGGWETGPVLFVLINQQPVGTPNGSVTSYLAYTKDLFTFECIRPISSYIAGGPPAKFIQVSAWVVQKSDLPPYCPWPPPGPEPAGALLLGSAGNDQWQPGQPYANSYVHLAWLPLDPSDFAGVLSAPLWYYTGGGWSMSESDAQPLQSRLGSFVTPSSNRAAMTMLHVSGIPYWMMLFSTVAWWDHSGADHPVVARFSQTPWGPWSDELFLLWPDEAWGAYMSGPGAPLGCSDVCADPNALGTFYGAYHLPGLDQHDATTGQTTFYWVVSTYTPYQVMLMKTILQ